MVEALELAAAFVVGGFLVLERRCLGQMAIVQPLVVCLIVGLLFKENQAASIWIGIVLQLFSVTPIRKVDWTTGGTVAGFALLILSSKEVVLSAGSPLSALIIVLAVLVGTTANVLERRHHRFAGARLRSNSPWKSQDFNKTMTALVHGAVIRTAIVGGLIVAIGTAIIVLATLASKSILVTENSSNCIGLLAVPLVGLAVLVGSLAQKRLVIVTGACAAAFAAIVSVGMMLT